MKKLMKLLLASVVLSLVLSFSACAIGITCISHIDTDTNGKCDNCGQKVAVEAETNVEKIVIKTLPTKLYYALNDVLDLSGGMITVTYKDGTPTADIPLTAEGVSVIAPGMESAGMARVSVSYGGKMTSYTIEIGTSRFVVSFELGFEGGTAIPAQNVTVGGYATVPTDPAREGYDLYGWFTDKELTAEFDFALTPVTADITLYASWTRKYVVTYSANYVGGANQTASTIKGKADAAVTPAAREGYRFAGWYADKLCTTMFGFDGVVSSDITVYAKWVSDSTEMHTVKFNHNYGSTPTVSEVSVADGSPVAMPAAPKRASVSEKGHQASGFTFKGWYADAECTKAYVFATEVTSDITLFAKWTGNYVFEAEHVSFADPITGLPMQGMGASGGSVGPNMVDAPAPGMEGLNASNGYYVTYLYAPGLALNFMINSDRAVADATLVFRISAENVPFAINPMTSEGTTDKGTQLSQYLIMLNDESIDYETIEITDTTGHTGSGGRRPFSDFTVAVNLSLKKGMNMFTFMTSNLNGMGGTMKSTAPVIDCIKVSTSAELNWEPITGNEFGQ